jgi:hypothetical protein
LNSDWTKENGKEKLWYAENASGYVFLTSPMSDIPPGFMLKSTTKPKDMECVFNRIHAQERDHNSKIIENIHKHGQEHYASVRSKLLTRLASGSTSEAEKGIIRESLKLMDERDSKAQQNTIYGVSAMQEAPEPLPPSNKRIM